MKRRTALQLVGLLPLWAKARYGEGLAAHFAGRTDSMGERLTALRWALAARLAGVDERARGASKAGLGVQIRGHARRLVGSAALAAGGGIAAYAMVDDSPLARVVNAGGVLALDWRLFIASLLVAGTATGLMLVRLARERRGLRGFDAGQEAPSPSLLGHKRGGRLDLLGRVTAGALLAAAVSGLTIVSVTNAPFSLGPLQIQPATGRLAASILLSLGALSGLWNGRLMSRLIGFLSQRRR